MILYTDGLLEARESNLTGWVHVEWLYPGERAFKAFRAFKHAEGLIKTAGFRGWLMASERTHGNMHKHITRWGGIPYASDEGHIYFKKEVH